MSAEDEKTQWDNAAQGNAAWEVWSVEPDKWESHSQQCIAEIAAGLSLADEFPKGRRLLDLGCGIGRATLPIARLAGPDAMVIGLDISPKMIDHAIETAQAEHVTNVRFMVGNGRNLPTEVGRLAAAWSVVMLQHIPGYAVRGYIHAVAAHLGPGGVFHFQFCTGNAALPPEEVKLWCKESKIPVVRVTGSNIYDNWLWYTARKDA